MSLSNFSELAGIVTATVALILLIRNPWIGRYWIITLMTLAISVYLLEGVALLFTETANAGIILIIICAFLGVFLYAFGWSQSSQRYFDTFKPVSANQIGNKE